MSIGQDSESQPRIGRRRDASLALRREEEILEAAATLFAKNGYSNATTQELADLLQVGKGTVYRYFPTKEELFLAAVDRRMRQLVATIDAETEKVADPLERLCVAVRTYLRYFAEHPEVTELFIQERAHFKNRKKPTYFAYRDANLERRTELLRGLIADGRLREIPAEKIFEVVGDLLYGTMFINYFTGRDRLPEDQATDILDVVLMGILSESEREPKRIEAENQKRHGPQVSVSCAASGPEGKAPTRVQLGDEDTKYPSHSSVGASSFRRSMGDGLECKPLRET